MSSIRPDKNNNDSLEDSLDISSYYTLARSLASCIVRIDRLIGGIIIRAILVDFSRFYWHTARSSTHAAAARARARARARTKISARSFAVRSLFARCSLARLARLALLKSYSTLGPALQHARFVACFTVWGLEHDYLALIRKAFKREDARDEDIDGKVR